MVLMLYSFGRLLSGVQHPTILQEMVCSLLSFALFLTDRFPHQQMSPKVMTLLTKVTVDVNILGTVGEKTMN